MSSLFAEFFIVYLDKHIAVKSLEFIDLDVTIQK